jgi:hypothetical protein
MGIIVAEDVYNASLNFSDISHVIETGMNETYQRNVLWGCTESYRAEQNDTVPKSSAAEKPQMFYDTAVAELLYGGFDVNYIGLKGKIQKATFKFSVDKKWVSNNSVDIETVLLRRMSGNGWETVSTYLIGEDENNYYYSAVSNNLSTFAIVANSPPLICSICKPGDWSACKDGKQSRIGQECGPQTDYTCRPRAENRVCDVPLAEIPPTSMPLDVIIVPMIGLAIGAYLIITRKKPQRQLQ